MSRMSTFLCILVLATAILCEDTTSTKAPEHQQKDQPKQAGAFGNPLDHLNMGEMPKGPDSKQQQQQQQQTPNFNHN